MKFQPEVISGFNAIQQYTPDSVTVNGVVWRESLILPAVGTVEAWGVASFDRIDASCIERLVQGGRPELVLFGSGSRLRFPSAATLRPLIELGIGFETMDTPAACRTYNVLVSEGRRVTAGLLLTA